MNKEMNFDELMNELSKTLEILEKGDLSLEDSMKSYEKGIGLVRCAEEKLKNMEGHMEEILADGTVKDLKLDVFGEQDEQA